MVKVAADKTQSQLFTGFVLFLFFVCQRERLVDNSFKWAVLWKSAVCKLFFNLVATDSSRKFNTKECIQRSVKDAVKFLSLVTPMNSWLL